MFSKKICWQTNCQCSSQQDTFTGESFIQTRIDLLHFKRQQKTQTKTPKKTTKKPNQTKECRALMVNSNDEHWKNWILENKAKQVESRIKVQFLKKQIWFNHLNKFQNKTMDFSLSIFKLTLKFFWQIFYGKSS